MVYEHKGTKKQTFTLIDGSGFSTNSNPKKPLKFKIKISLEIDWSVSKWVNGI